MKTVARALGCAFIGLRVFLRSVSTVARQEKTGWPVLCWAFVNAREGIGKRLKMRLLSSAGTGHTGCQGALLQAGQGSDGLRCN